MQFSAEFKPSSSSSVVPRISNLNNMQTVNSNDNLPRVWDIIRGLQNVVLASAYNNVTSLQLARSTQVVTIPDLETPYSRDSLSNMNYCGTEPKDRTISAVITERQQQLDAVLDEISGLETVMRSIENLRQQLVKKKDKITQSMNLHKRLVSTLWRLPAEVLSQIFRYCVLEFHTPQLPPTLALLTGVCRQWREVAVGTPNLWCKLYVPIVSSRWEGQAFCYHTWLKWSRGRPLSLAFQFDANDSTKLQSFLQPCINQISSLYIRVDVLDEDEDEDAFQPDIFGQCLYHHVIRPDNPVWAHLTNVEIDIQDPDTFLHLLQLGPNLSSLKVYVANSRIWTLYLEPLTHTELLSLRISFGCLVFGNQISGLFNALSLPNLRVLEVGYAEPWPHEELKAFLGRSNILETLKILRPAVVTDEQRAEYVALLPSLDNHPSEPIKDLEEQQRWERDDRAYADRVIVSCNDDAARQHSETLDGRFIPIHVQSMSKFHRLTSIAVFASEPRDNIHVCGFGSAEQSVDSVFFRPVYIQRTVMRFDSDTAQELNRELAFTWPHQMSGSLSHLVLPIEDTGATSKGKHEASNENGKIGSSREIEGCPGENVHRSPYGSLLEKMKRMSIDAPLRKFPPDLALFPMDLP
ncbi:hypothetical protein DFH29DRAFT_871534 [Suillus ampliporus]|nr:hypothetical protein DFH29DRAFT_871534 [Suillus ampliporus]